MKKISRLSVFLFILPLLLCNCGGGGGGGTSSGSAPVAETGTINLAWDSDSSFDNGYTIYYGTTSGEYDYSVDVPPPISPTTTYRLSNLMPGKTYFIAVTAVSSDGESPYSNEVSAIAH